MPSLIILLLIRNFFKALINITTREEIFFIFYSHVISWRKCDFWNQLLLLILAIYFLLIFPQIFFWRCNYMSTDHTISDQAIHHSITLFMLIIILNSQLLTFFLLMISIRWPTSNFTFSSLFQFHSLSLLSSFRFLRSRRPFMAILPIDMTPSISTFFSLILGVFLNFSQLFLSLAQIEALYSWISHQSNLYMESSFLWVYLWLQWSHCLEERIKRHTSTSIYGKGSPLEAAWQQSRDSTEGRSMSPFILSLSTCYSLLFVVTHCSLMFLILITHLICHHFNCSKFSVPLTCCFTPDSETIAGM